MRFEISADRKIIENMLENTEVGQLVTYEALSKAIGRDVRTYASGALQGARKALLQKRIVFDCESKVGLVRLNDAQIIDSTESERARIMRASKRGLQKLASVEFSKLSDEEKKKHVARSAVFGTLTMFSTASSVKKIENHATVKEMAIGETLKLFG